MNSVFKSQLVIRALSPYEITGLGREVALWELMQPFSYDSASLGFTLTAPQGMITDFASIPRAVWDDLAPDDPVILFPSIIHDYLYTVGGKVSDTQTVTREQADAVLLEAMEVCGAGRFIRNSVYQFVQQFAASHWPTP